MGRPNESGLELSFHKATKRWCKVIAKKRYYFGPGKSASDMPSYRRALAEYREFMDSTRARLQVQVVARALRAQLHAIEEEEQVAIRKREAIGLYTDAETDAAFQRAVFARRHQLQLARARGTEAELLQGRSPIEFEAGGAPKKGWRQGQGTSHPTVSNCVDRYCDAREPETREVGGHQRLTPHAFLGIKRGLKTFQDFVGDGCWGNPETNENLLARYRNHLLQKVEDGAYTPNTFNDKVKHLKRHFSWLYQQRLIVEMPRNVREACAKLKTLKQGKPLSVKQVHAIWAVARDEVRCWIALGLNAGFYSKDISDLRPRDVDVVPGYVCRTRAKSDVPSRHMLWPVTQKLIGKTRCAGSDAAKQRLFLTAQKKLMNGAGRDLIGIQFKRAADKAGVAATFSQLRDTGAEFIEAHASKLGTYDPTLTQLYLSHRDNRTAVFYLSNDPATMKVPRLDKALKAMDKHFGLKL